MKLSDQVRELEETKGRLEEANRRLLEENQQMRRAVGGNVILQRRDGFSRATTFFCRPSFHGDDGLPYAIKQASCYSHYDYSPLRVAKASARIPIREETYERTRDVDEFGRVIYREV